MILTSEATDSVPSGDLSRIELLKLYAAPQRPWLRANMIATLDGAAQGGDGLSGSINNAADKRVFDVLRELADAVIVGAGTARAEGYHPVPGLPLVVVSASGRLPEALVDADNVLLATTTDAPELASVRQLIDGDRVLTLGVGSVDTRALREALIARGWGSLLCEGGPALLRTMFAAGVVDELCLTQAPRLVAGESKRILAGEEIDVHLAPMLLLEQDGTLLGRWRVQR